MSTYVTKNRSGDWRALNDLQQKKYLDTVVSLNNAMISRKACLIYRGVGVEHLKEIFSQDIDVNKLMGKIFYFGEKSRYFYRDDSSAQAPMKKVDEYSGELATELFRNFAKLGRESPDDLGVDRLIKKDPDFFRFFEENKNEKIFRRKLLLIGEEAFTYYLAALHTAGMPKAKSWSVFLSSSSEPRVAENFPPRLEGAFIVTAVYRRRNERNSAVVLSKERLPILSPGKSFFPGEQEITLSGALMPHNILHVRQRDTDRYWVNPYLFSPENAKIDMGKEMLYIDQSDFAERLARETSYNGWFYRLSNGRIIHGGFVDARSAPAFSRRGQKLPDSEK